MPLYEYHCRKCDAEFEEIRSMNERWHTSCECGHMALQTFRTPPNTDVYGHTVHDPIQGITYTSASEREKKMKEDGGWEPAGDKVGGARNDSYRNLGKAFSGKGLRHRGSSEMSNEASKWTPK